METNTHIIKKLGDSLRQAFDSKDYDAVSSIIENAYSEGEGYQILSYLIEYKAENRYEEKIGDYVTEIVSRHPISEGSIEGSPYQKLIDSNIESIKTALTKGDSDLALRIFKPISDAPEQAKAIDFMDQRKLGEYVFFSAVEGQKELTKFLLNHSNYYLGIGLEQTKHYGAFLAYKDTAVKLIAEIFSHRNQYKFESKHDTYHDLLVILKMLVSARPDLVKAQSLSLDGVSLNIIDEFREIKSLNEASKKFILLEILGPQKFNELYAKKISGERDQVISFSKIVRIGDEVEETSTKSIEDMLKTKVEDHHTMIRALEEISRVSAESHDPDIKVLEIMLIAIIQTHFINVELVENMLKSSIEKQDNIIKTLENVRKMGGMQQSPLEHLFKAQAEIQDTIIRILEEVREAGVRQNTPAMNALEDIIRQHNSLMDSVHEMLNIQDPAIKLVHDMLEKVEKEQNLANKLLKASLTSDDEAEIAATRLAKDETRVEDEQQNTDMKLLKDILRDGGDIQSFAVKLIEDSFMSPEQRDTALKALKTVLAPKEEMQNIATKLVNDAFNISDEERDTIINVIENVYEIKDPVQRIIMFKVKNDLKSNLVQADSDQAIPDEHKESEGGFGNSTINLQSPNSELPPYHEEENAENSSTTLLGSDEGI